MTESWNGRYSDHIEERGLRSLIHRFTGLKLAPFYLPLHRRLETLAVHGWLYTFLFAGPLCLIASIYTLLYTRLWWVVAVYLCYHLYDRGQEERGGRRCSWIRGWKQWHYYKAYFPLTLVKTADLPPDRNYIFCYHPHGILAIGAFAHFGTTATGFPELFPGVTPYPATIPFHFMFPFYRDYVMAHGIVSSSQRSLRHVLGKEASEADPGSAGLLLVVGGARESLDARSGTVVLHLSTRKGFVRLALSTGASLVPVFAFGENDVLPQAHNPRGSRLRSFQDWTLTRTTIAPIILLGRGLFQYSFGIAPHRRPICSVVGAAINVSKCSNPGSDLINALHTQYVEALKQLYYAHRQLYPAFANVEMIIV